MTYNKSKQQVMENIDFLVLALDRKLMMKQDIVLQLKSIAKKYKDVETYALDAIDEVLMSKDIEESELIKL